MTTAIITPPTGGSQVVPERSQRQRLEALQRANEVRTGKAELKRDLKAGRTQVTDVLRDPPDLFLNVKVFEILLAAPKCGRVKVNRLLTAARVSPSKTLGGLSERQRGELLARLMGVR